MSNIRYANQANFNPWDLLASLGEMGATHPFFADRRGGPARGPEHNNNDPFDGHFGWGPFGPMPHRGPRRGAHPPPPPPPPHEGAHPPPPPSDGPHHPPPHHPRGRSPPPPFQDRPDDDTAADPPSRAPTPPTPSESRERGPHHGPNRRGSHHHRGGHGRRGGCGGPGGRHRHGPWGRPGQFPFDLNNLAEMFQDQLFGGNATATATANTVRNGSENNNGDFVPEIDIFDTERSYIVHASLPGAKKSDISVSWAAEKSSLIISGVVHRPGNEELLSTLALDERKVGAFERTVKLGSAVSGEQVDPEGITAKLEEGILRIEVPKLNEEEFVEVKKVDIE